MEELKNRIIHGDALEVLGQLLWYAADVANAQKGSKNARGGKVASVLMQEGKPPCQVYAEVGKR